MSDVTIILWQDSGDLAIYASLGLNVLTYITRITGFCVDEMKGIDL